MFENINKLLLNLIDMRKRGQFYLIAAIVIITVILGIAAVSNYSKKKENVRLYDLKDELGIESGEVIEYGVYNKDLGKLPDFTQKYAKYAGEGKNLIFVYGDENGIKTETFTETLTGTISLQSGETSQQIPLTEQTSQTDTIEPTGSQITVTLPNGRTHTFDLQQGQNFFFIISQDVDGETYVETS